MEAFLFGGINMFVHRCRKCIWSNKISRDLLYCIFPRCIMKRRTGVCKNESKETPKALQAPRLS